MSDPDHRLPDTDPAPPDPPTPWGFRITLAAATAYLAWRLIEGIVWLVGRIL